MSENILIAVIGVVGTLLAVLLTHYLQKRKTDKDRTDRFVVEHHVLDLNPPTREEVKAEDRTYYKQRLTAIINCAQKYSVAIKQGWVSIFIFALIFGLIVAFKGKSIGYGILYFLGIFIFSAPLNGFQTYDCGKRLRKEIELSKLDRSALFDLKSKSEENKSINPKLRVYLTKIIDRELKRL